MTTRLTRRADRSSGFSLMELMVVLALMGLLAAMVGPDLTQWLRSLRAGTVGDQLAADLALARAQAVRNGRTASLRVVSGTYYAVTLDDAAGAATDTVARRNVAQDNPGVTVEPTAARIAFDSRGVLRSDSSTLRVTKGAFTERIQVSLVGRVYRED